MKGERFPIKVHRILEDAEARGFEDIIGWCPGGKSFVVRNKQRLEKEVMSFYFASDKFKSFQRSLNLWGFQKRKKTSTLMIGHQPSNRHIVKEEEEGYCHPLFIRGRIDLCDRMLRERIKQPGTRNHAKETMTTAVSMEKCKRQTEQGPTTTEQEGPVATAVAAPPYNMQSFFLKEKQVEHEEGRQPSNQAQVTKKNLQQWMITQDPPLLKCSASAIMSESRGCPRPKSVILESSMKEDEANNPTTAIRARIMSSLQGCTFLPPPAAFSLSDERTCQQQLVGQTFLPRTYRFNDPRMLSLAAMANNDVQGNSFLCGFPHATTKTAGGGLEELTHALSRSRGQEWNQLLLKGLMVKLLSDYAKEQGTRNAAGY